MAGDVFSFIGDKQDSGEGVVLATVVKSRGSAPVAAGTRMAVTAREISGTVGGGPLEAKVIEAAREALDAGRPRLLGFKLDGDEAGGLGMLCGGEQEIFLDVINPVSRILIFGGGHVGQALARAAATAGYPSTVLDDREEFVEPSRFPEGCRTVRIDFAGDWSGLGITAETSIVIVTRGHSFDRLCLERAIATPAGYIGMIGSRKKVAATLAALAEAGVAAGKDERVYAPVGLDLGGNTPEEIAVSILAEIIAVRQGRTGGHLRKEVGENA
jgi:xanthine dehydrogenase accessory factor